MTSLLRSAASGSRHRLRSGAVDLDLTYITPRLIAMGMPCTGLEAAFRNRASDVAGYLDAAHPGAYLIINLARRAYDAAPFGHRVVHWGFQNKRTCPLELLLTLCRTIDAFLEAHPAHVVAVHCSAGKGRTGLVLASYVLYSGHFLTEYGRAEGEAAVGALRHTAAPAAAAAAAAAAALAAAEAAPDVAATAAAAGATEDKDKEDEEDEDEEAFHGHSPPGGSGDGAIDVDGGGAAGVIPLTPQRLADMAVCFFVYKRGDGLSVTSQRRWVALVARLVHDAALALAAVGGVYDREAHRVTVRWLLDAPLQRPPACSSEGGGGSSSEPLLVEVVPRVAAGEVGQQRWEVAQRSRAGAVGGGAGGGGGGDGGGSAALPRRRLKRRAHPGSCACVDCNGIPSSPQPPPHPTAAAAAPPIDGRTGAGAHPAAPRIAAGGGGDDDEPMCELLHDDQEDGVNNAGRSSVTADTMMDTMMDLGDCSESAIADAFRAIGVALTSAGGEGEGETGGSTVRRREPPPAPPPAPPLLLLLTPGGGEGHVAAAAPGSAAEQRGPHAMTHTRGEVGGEHEGGGCERDDVDAGALDDEGALDDFDDDGNDDEASPPPPPLPPASLDAALAADPQLPQATAALLRDVELPPPPEVLVWQVLLHGIPAVGGGGGGVGGGGSGGLPGVGALLHSLPAAVGGSEGADGGGAGDGGGCRPALRVLRLSHVHERGAGGGPPPDATLHDSAFGRAPGEPPRYVSRATHSVVPFNLSTPIAGDVLLRVAHAPGDVELACVSLHTGFLPAPTTAAAAADSGAHAAPCLPHQQQEQQPGGRQRRRPPPPSSSPSSSAAVVATSEVFRACDMDVRLKRGGARLPPGFAIEVFYDVRVQPRRERGRGGVVEPLSAEQLAAALAAPPPRAPPAPDDRAGRRRAASAAGGACDEPLAAALWAPGEAPAVTERDVLHAQFFHAGYGV